MSKIIELELFEQHRIVRVLSTCANAFGSRFMNFGTFSRGHYQPAPVGRRAAADRRERDLCSRKCGVADPHREIHQEFK